MLACLQHVRWHVDRVLLQLLGELNLDEIKCGDSDGACEPGKTAATGPIMLFVYMLIGNVVMVNLLIAMMSDTYASVEEKSLEVWRFQKFELVKEYREAYQLPPPLVLISFVHRVAAYIRARWQGYTGCLDRYTCRHIQTQI